MTALSRPLGAALLAALLVTPAAAQGRRGGAPAAGSGAAGDSAAGRLPLDGMRFRSIGPGSTSGRISDIAVHPRTAEHLVRRPPPRAGSGRRRTPASPSIADLRLARPRSRSAPSRSTRTCPAPCGWARARTTRCARWPTATASTSRSTTGARSRTSVSRTASTSAASSWIRATATWCTWRRIGPLWSGGGDRGLYKTTDGGTTWERILGGGEWAGVNDVQMDPRNPDLLHRLHLPAAAPRLGPDPRRAGVGAAPLHRRRQDVDEAHHRPARR